MNKKQKKEYNKKWRLEHSKEVREYKKKVYKINYKNNIKFRIIALLRSRLYIAFKEYTKNGKIMKSKYYGIRWKPIILKLIKTKPIDFVKQKYHIEHIIPLSSFNLENPKEIKIAFSSSNHRWLLAKDNLSKGSKLNWSK